MSLLPKLFSRGSKKPEQKYYKDKRSELEESLDLIKKYRANRRALQEEIDADPLMDNERRNQLKKAQSVFISLVMKYESKMFDIDRGMYNGLGVNLLSTTDNLVGPSFWEWDKITNHWGVQGASGVGKTILMLTHTKQIIQKGWNVIITDPKGGHGQEIVNAVASFTKEAGREEDFVYMSPAYPDMHYFANLLYGMGDSEVASLASSLLNEDGQADPFYESVAYNVIYATCSGLRLLQFINDPTGEETEREEAREFATFDDYLQTKSFDAVFDSEHSIGTPDAVQAMNTEGVFREEKVAIPDANNRSMITFRTLSYYSQKENLATLEKTIAAELAQVPTSAPHYKQAHYMNETVAAVFKSIAKQDEAFFTKVTQQLTTTLLKLSTGEMGELLCRFKINPIIPRLIDPDRGMVMVLQPFPMRFGSVSDMFIKIIFKHLEVFMGNIGSTERKLSKRLVLQIDEAGSVAYPGIESLFNKARSLGLTLGVYTQSFQDWIDSLDETKAKITMDNINTTVRMRMNDGDSCKLVSEEVGMIKEMRSTTIASSEAATKAIIGAEENDIISPTDVSMIPVGRGIVKYDGGIRLVDFAHYGKTFSNIVFDENKYFNTMDKLNESLKKGMREKHDFKSKEAEIYQELDEEETVDESPTDDTADGVADVEEKEVEIINEVSTDTSEKVEEAKQQ